MYAERHHVDDVELIGLDKLSDGSCRLIAASIVLQSFCEDANRRFQRRGELSVFLLRPLRPGSAEYDKMPKSLYWRSKDRRRYRSADGLGAYPENLSSRKARGAAACGLSTRSASMLPMALANFAPCPEQGEATIIRDRWAVDRR